MAGVIAYRAEVKKKRQRIGSEKKKKDWAFSSVHGVWRTHFQENQTKKCWNAKGKRNHQSYWGKGKDFFISFG